MLWEQFLTDNGIEYVTSGPNTKRGEISVKCPWCGDDDPSQHLGINLTKDAWGCHRNAEHRGKSPLRLIQALLRCSASHAHLTLKQHSHSDADGLEQAIKGLTEEVPEQQDGLPDVTEWSRDFRTFDQNSRFGQYLVKRGYPQVAKIVYQFNLKCATTGRYKDRIIFPLYLNRLVGWTARAIIDPVTAPRYLASSDKVKMTVYGYERAQFGGDTLVVVEGPFDALNINRCSFVDRSVSAVAIMGTSLSISQLCLLRALMKRFSETKILLDDGAVGQAWQIAELLGSSRVVQSVFLRREGYTDPASLPERDLQFII